jgi:hypothetical protein
VLGGFTYESSRSRVTSWPYSMERPKHSAAEPWRFEQFEFGGTNMGSPTFIRDLYDVLGPEFEIHRALRDGSRPLGSWGEHLEIFGLGNYVALRRARR